MIQMKNKYKLILFDVDGTFVDTDTLVKESYRHLFSIYNKDFVLTEEIENSFLGPTLREVFPKYFKEDMKTLEKTYRDFSFSHGYLAKLYDQDLKVTKFLKNKYKLGIVTSRYLVSLKKLFEDINVPLSLFETIVTLDDVKEAKPNPEGILLAVKKMNVSSEETLYIGDNYTDFLASKGACVDFCLAKYARRKMEDITCKYQVDSFDQLLDILGGKND